MKKGPMKSRVHTAGKSPASVFAVAALVFLLLLAGCASKPAAEPVAAIPAMTVQTTAADACYRKTPVITDISTHLEFATCMKNTPLPSGNCARNFRYYVLKSTNEDVTTAGFARQTTTARLAREAFLRGEGYDGVRLEYVPCGNATLIMTSFYQ